MLKTQICVTRPQCVKMASYIAMVGGNESCVGEWALSLTTENSWVVRRAVGCGYKRRNYSLTKNRSPIHHVHLAHVYNLIPLLLGTSYSWWRKHMTSLTVLLGGERRPAHDDALSFWEMTDFFFYCHKLFGNLSLCRNRYEACPNADIGDLVFAVADLILVKGSLLLEITQ